MRPAAVVVVSVPWRVVPGVVPMVGRRRVLVPWPMVPGVILVMRPLSVSRVVPCVMVVRVQPIVIVMTPRGPVGVDATVVGTQGMPLAGAVPRRVRPLRERDAA
ncbi:MAG TPA: hypothetical protein VFD61_12695 [Gaiellales bacterium]|nr:hypothetical protein [Gaiellales bacterium]